MLVCGCALAQPAIALAQEQASAFVLNAAGEAEQARQVPPAARRRPVQAPPRKGIGYRVYFATDFTAMRAADTFAAVTGSSEVTAFGGAAEVLRVWRGLFLRGGITRAALSGERSVGGDQIGIPIEIRMLPIEAAGGWRAETGAKRGVGAYLGGGLLRLGYQESSEFATTGDTVDKSFTGYLVLAGADLTIGKRLVVGFEGQFRSVPNAIGQVGNSKLFGESDLGGFTARVLIGLRK